MHNIHKSKEFGGIYRGFVVDNKDPEELLRAKLRVPEVSGQEITDWATPAASFYGGYADGGTAFPPEIGSGVFVMYEHGNVDMPVYLGGWYANVKGEDGTIVKEVSKRVRGKIDNAISASKGQKVGKTEPFVNKDDGLDFDTDVSKEIKEPSSPFAGEYTKVKQIKTISGHVLEFDDTKEEERVLLFHKEGSFLEFRKDRDVVFKSSKKYELVDGEHIEHISKHEIKLVEGSEDLTIKGQQKQVIGELSRTEYRGDRKVVIRGKHNHFVDSDEERHITGRTVEKFGSSVKRHYASSVTDTIGSQFERTVVQTSSETINNLDRAEVAKSLDILFGDYTVDIEEGDEKHTLVLGNAEWTLIEGDEIHTLSPGEGETGNVIWTLLDGDWDTIITTGNETHTITTGNWTTNIELGHEEHNIVTADGPDAVIWKTTIGNYTITMGVGDFILSILTGNISMTTASGDISITAPSGSITIAAGTALSLSALSSFTASSTGPMSMSSSSTLSMMSAAIATLSAIGVGISGITSIGSAAVPGVGFTVPFAELMFSVYNSHTHITTAPGFPTTVPNTTPLVPFTHSSPSVRTTI